MLRVPRRYLVARLVLPLILVVPTVLVGVPTSGASTVSAPDSGAALTWLEGELAADGGSLSTAYDDGSGGVATFPDWGLTIDAILALAAGGRGGEAAATTAAGLVQSHVGDYVTGGAFGPDDRYAGALGKTLLMTEVLGMDSTNVGGFDLAAELRARLQTSGADAGRFSDLTAFGDFSNGFGQALAVLALARTPDPVPSSAVDFLLAQQCPGGEFRGDYTDPGGCTDDAAASVDATGFAVQALTAVPPTCATRQAVTDAVAALVADQDAGGAFGGVSGSNANSTGLAAVALRSLGQTAAADAAAGFIAALQLTSGAETGAVALNPAGLAAAADGIQVLERDGFRRATTQGVLAFGLPSYSEIGASAIDPAAFVPCPVPPPLLPPPTGSLSAGTVAPGGSLTVTASGFDAGESVTATLHSAPVSLGTLAADGTGAVSLTFIVPADLEPGTHALELVGASSARTLSLTFEVVATAPASPQILPVTGTPTGSEASVGLTLVVLGAGLLAAARRRRGALT